MNKIIAEFFYFRWFEGGGLFITKQLDAGVLIQEGVVYSKEEA